MLVRLKKKKIDLSLYKERIFLYFARCHRPECVIFRSPHSLARCDVKLDIQKNKGSIILDKRGDFLVVLCPHMPVFFIRRVGAWKYPM